MSDQDYNANQPAGDDIAAAEAELRAAQQKLEEARAKLKEDAEAIELEAQPVTEAAPAAEAGAAATGYDGAVAPEAQAPQPQGAAVPPPPPGAQPYQPPQYGQQPHYQQPQYQQSQYGQQGQQYQQPQYAAPASKDRIVAGLLGIFLGSLGIHKFYLGYTKAGVIMLLITLVGGIITLSIAAWVMAVIGLIEGILYLTKSQAEFEQIYVYNQKEWF